MGVVGPCAAGKSTLTAGLRQRGYQAKHIAQEHSYVPDMWQRLTRPDILIYLHVSYLFSMQRRLLNWTEEEFNEQLHRLRHARQHANLFIDTNPLSAQEVLQQVLSFLTSTVDHSPSSPH